MLKRKMHPIFTILFLMLASSGIAKSALPEQKEYIGRAVCSSCHAEQSKAWQGSHHDLAMEEANNKSVLGNFNNAQSTHFGVTSTFFKKDGKFMVNTDGPDGSLQDYSIKYTFGVYPLQQYLIEFPEGRLQALDIAWDSRPKAESGQRWFHLHPDEKITHDDVLHWTGPNLNWNYMCADCHSTNLKKNYDNKAGEYHTSWSEMDVSCEACHGPGSEHKKWAETIAGGSEYKIANKGLTVELNERKGINWLIDEKSGKPVRSKPNEARAEIQICARCHSRRSQLTDDFTPGQPFMDAYHPSLLTDGFYYPDGQMQDEVYVWGSFRQSKMYESGVTCSDCHDPHAADLKVPGEQVCYQCHAADRYTRKEHHFHVPDSAGASCVECHMPATTFMGVDKRHDHSFRIPRPDLSVSMGTPNACNQCHSDQTVVWALERIKSWYGRQPQGYQQYSATLNAARQGHIDAGSLLLKLAMDPAQPAIARATALSGLGGRLDRNSMMLIQQALNDADPLIRQGALTALESAPVQQRMLGFPLVWDDVRSVRVQAGRLMAGFPVEHIAADRRDKLNQVIQEYIRTQEFNDERPESQINLAGLYTDLQQFDKAEAAYRKALQLQSKFIPTYINFAQLLSNRGREKEAEGLLSNGIKQNPDSAILYHALGLSLVRQKQLEIALGSLSKAAELDPNNTRFSYVYAIALHSSGNINHAIEVLSNTLEGHPEDLEILHSLVTIYRDIGNKQKAQFYAKRLKQLSPGKPDVNALIQTIESE